MFLAGARTLVLSQWKVDDTATALLMQRFYQNLRGQRPGLAEPLPKATALAEAKQWLCRVSRTEADDYIRELPGLPRGSEKPSATPVVEAGDPDRPYSHPYYWAGFILIGEPGDVSLAVPVLAVPERTGPGGTPPEPESKPLWWPWAVAVAALAVAGLWCRRRFSWPR